MSPQQQLAELNLAEAQPRLELLKPEYDRTCFIGGTDVAGILGQSRYKTPLQVWAEKTKRIPIEDISDKMPVRVGIKLEQTVCEFFMEETGKKLHRVNETIFHPRHPFLAANLDRRVVGENAIFEAKTCAAWKSKEWADNETPAEYLFQILHYMLVTGKEKAYLAILIGNEDFQWRVFERNEKLLNDLLKREVEFWKEYVEKDVMPTMITKYDGDTLSKLYPVANETEIVLGDDSNIIIENLKALEADAKNLEGMIEQQKNELKLKLGDAAKGYTTLNEVRWVNSKRSQLDSKALLEQMPEIHKQFYRTTPNRRFTYGPIKIMEAK